MCGGFVSFAVGATDLTIKGKRSVKTKLAGLWLHASYNSGRLMVYLIMGTISGTIGAAFDLGGSLVGVQQAAAILAGGMMILFGTVLMLRLSGVRIEKLPLPKAIHTRLVKFASSGHQFASHRPPVVRALLIGLLTTILPCGWLYAFVITAAGTGSPLAGAATMAAFWLGTVPMLVGVGLGVQKLAGVLGRVVPVATAGAIMILGIITVVNRAGMPAMGTVMGAAMTNQSTPVDPHSHVQPINQKELPCCNADGQ